METKPVTKVASVEPGLTDPVYVEKLASAIDFIHDNYESFGLDKVAAYAPAHKAGDKPGHKPPFMKAVAKEEKAAPAVDSKMADKVKASLAEGLKKKMKTKEADVAVQDDAVVQSVLAKLLRMRGEVEVPAEKAEETPEPAQETESLPEEGEATEVKAASLADLSLADVLEGALRANELEEGVSKERSKTASVRGEKGPMARKAAVESLKQGLMAKFGKEA
jgi:hypothetical protein